MEKTSESLNLPSLHISICQTNGTMNILAIIAVSAPTASPAAADADTIAMF